MLDIKTFMFNLLQENTYVVSDESKECVIIDCGAYYDEERDALVNYINDNELKPMHLLCTHGHFDHNFGIDTIYKHYGLLPEIAREDYDLVTHLSEQFQSMIGVPLKREYPNHAQLFGSDEVIRFGSHELQILKTPGHTRGGVVFYCEQEKVVFSGDTLFRMSVGRTDFEGGSYTELMNSLKNVLGKMPAETTVYSGHGPKTTIGEEMRYNPYLH